MQSCKAKGYAFTAPARHSGGVRTGITLEIVPNAEHRCKGAPAQSQRNQRLKRRRRVNAAIPKAANPAVAGSGTVQSEQGVTPVRINSYSQPDSS